MLGLTVYSEMSTVLEGDGILKFCFAEVMRKSHAQEKRDGASAKSAVAGLWRRAEKVR
jgi:hypothetical protein